MKAWQNSKKLWKHSPGWKHLPAVCVLTAFLFLPNFHLCFYISLETWYSVHVFYFLNNEGSWTPVIFPTLGAEIQEKRGVQEPLLYMCIFINPQRSSYSIVFKWVSHSFSSLQASSRRYLVPFCKLKFQLYFIFLWDHKYGLLTKCEVKMAGYWPSTFLCVYNRQRWSWGSINSQKENDANIQQSWPTSLVNKGFITWLSGEIFLAGYSG